MTTQRWTDSMLDTLAGVVASQSGELATLGGIVQNTTNNVVFLIEERRQDRAEFRDLLSVLQLMQQEIQEIRSDIRGLQTENRRILERLEAHFGDGHGG
jgi:chromosome segregation ATPase